MYNISCPKEEYNHRYESPIGEDWWKDDIYDLLANLIGAPIVPSLPTSYVQFVLEDGGYGLYNGTI
jgi:hypothetical protein